MRLATAFDGQFYPGRREELREEVDRLLAEARPFEGEILGLLVPHAGYVYSGATAGRAIGLLAGLEFDAVVLMGPSHRVYFEGIRVLDLEGYETPLGPMPGDSDLAAEIAGALGYDALQPGFPEHSVEVQLPLLDRVLPGVPVVQIVFGANAEEEIGSLVDALTELGEKRRIVVLASSDLSHHHPRTEAQELDGRFRELLLSGDASSLHRALARGETEACGATPVLCLMEYARSQDARLELVDQTDSSEAFGDEDQVVGYLSAVAVRGRGER